MIRSDITIFMEVVMPQALSLSRENWLIPNSEWWNPLNDRFLPQFTKILCKTKDCYDIWCQKVGASKCVYTSYEARDIYQPDIAREVKFLHVAGKSEYKNTDAVLRAWRMTHLQHISALPHLTVVARAPIFDEHFREDTPFPDNNVTYVPRATDEEIIQWMNSHRFHIIPSMYEGFGHVIHEALGCGGLVLTTDAPPMNTYEGVLRECIIPVCTRTPRMLAQLNMVAPQAVNESVRKALNLFWTQPDMAAERSQQARAAFLANREFFRAKIMELVNGIRR
jgi:glycosyltransferase involved in cell wall biosynthesis